MTDFLTHGEATSDGKGVRTGTLTGSISSLELQPCWHYHSTNEERMASVHNPAGFCLLLEGVPCPNSPSVRKTTQI